MDKQFKILNTKAVFFKDEVGGKAHYLKKMEVANFNIPKFLCIPKESINTILNPVRSDIEKELKSKNTVFDKSKRIKTLILSISIVEAIRKHLIKVCNDFFGDNYIIAVRSSALDEDGTETSFAGQHKSFMFVQENDLINKIMQCIISAWSVNALTYRTINNIPIKDIQYAVILQKMIESQVSGIGFSMNIQGNLANMIIVSGYGLGEGIVSDLVETDTFYIDRLHKNISAKINLKKEKIVFIPNKGIRKTEVVPYLQEKSSLSNKQIRNIVAVLEKAEELLENIADIEFSFKNEKLYILQMRPVTKININDIKILDNTNIGESYPEISLPLTFSFVKNAYQKVFENTSKSFWITSTKRKELKPIFKDLVGYYQGRIYYRLDNWYQMMSQILPSKKTMTAWENAVGLKKDQQDGKHISYGNNLKIYLSFFWLLINYTRGNKQFYKKFEAIFSKIKSFDKKKSAAALLKHQEIWSDKLTEIWHYTLINDLIAFKSFNLLQNLIRKYNIGEIQLANDLLSGQINSESEKAIIELLKIKAIINNDINLKQLFLKSNNQIIRELQKNSFSNFYKKLINYAEIYGDRTFSELKLETTSLRTDYLKLIDLIKSQLYLEHDLENYKKNQIEIYQNVITKIKINLKFWNPNRYLLFLIKNISIYALKNRENMRFSRTRIYSVVKDIYLEIATILVNEKKTNEKKDIFYLTIDEIENLKNYTDIISKRKQLFDNYKLQKVPNRIFYIDKPFMLNEFINIDTSNKLKGIAVSKGKVRAKVIIITTPKYDLDIQNKILVTKTTDPGWVFLMSQSVGLISERGSLLSHTAIVGRELGIPVVVGIPNITQTLQNGMLVELNGSDGTIRIIS